MNSMPLSAAFGLYRPVFVLLRLYSRWMVDAARFLRAV